MRKDFIPLAQRFRAPRASVVQEEAPVEIAGEPTEPASDVDELARDVRLFRARLEELLDEALNLLLCDIASGVLARELQLAPADIERIAASAMERYLSSEPLRVRVHPSECDLRLDCAVVADERVRSGDVILELRDGTVDASLGVRLAAALHRAQP